MKSNRVRSFFYFVFACIVLACQNEDHNGNHKSNIYGSWMLEDILLHVDSSKSILGHKQFFCSEIVISGNTDSAIIINGDKESWKIKVDSINENEISMKLLSAMPYSNLYLLANGKLFYYDSAAKKSFYFIKNKNNPVSSSSIRFSALKYEINKKLFEHNFTDVNTKTNIYFNAFNAVNGIEGFTNYETFINHPKTRLSDDNLMELSNPKTNKKELFIWKFEKDTLNLYFTQNFECKECKPFYERGAIWKSFIKQ